MQVDTELLNKLYVSPLMSLRERAEASNLPKSGSVEVLRARLIKHHSIKLRFVMGRYTINASQRNREVLKIFGIKSSGSHKEKTETMATSKL